MDGPQLGSRWPGRYAGVLADEPGCSVLTFTCADRRFIKRAFREAGNAELESCAGDEVCCRKMDSGTRHRVDRYFAGIWIKRGAAKVGEQGAPPDNSGQPLR